jgi:hypothetical protein
MLQNRTCAGRKDDVLTDTPLLSNELENIARIISEVEPSQCNLFPIEQVDSLHENLNQALCACDTATESDVDFLLFLVRETCERECCFPELVSQRFRHRLADCAGGRGPAENICCETERTLARDGCQSMLLPLRCFYVSPAQRDASRQADF